MESYKVLRVGAAEIEEHRDGLFVLDRNAGRAYARVQLAATAAGVALKPLQQALQEYPEQAGPHAAIRSLLDASSSARTVQMWARAGFAPPVGPAPRRGLEAQLVRS